MPTKRGQNKLYEAPQKSTMARFMEQLNDPLIFVLFVAAAISMLMKEFADTAIILAVIFLNATIGVIQEGKADKALASLKKLSAPMAILLDGANNFKEIPACDLIPGDLVLLEAGMQVPADVKILDSTSLSVEESALTGESLPVDKKVGDIAFMSTILLKGRGLGRVEAIGMDTEIGKIATLINETKPEPTPLQKRLGDLGKLLSILSLALCAFLFFLALYQKRDVLSMLLTAISLAVAAVPEGLPAIVTMVLALSVSRMVNAGAIVRRLPGVETLGCVSVICTDKTGTLTQNKMTVTHFFTDGKCQKIEQLNKEKAALFLTGFTLCNDASLGASDYGDPTELALLHMAERFGINRTALERTYPRIGEIPFDSIQKKMTTTHLCHGKKISFLKGSPDVILRDCTRIQIGDKILPLDSGRKKRIEKALSEMTDQALRVLALAMKDGDLIFLGLVGMKDPLKPGVKEAISTCTQAGVKTVMITGDRADTACAIAKELGIATGRKDCLSGVELDALLSKAARDKRPFVLPDNIRVFAQVTPSHKTTIVNYFKAHGEIVSMTGDGVNDAPSLRAADVGVAMGLGGTDVAKSASDLILTDDNFATIVRAIEQGRCIYANIKKSVLFLLSSNFGEIITMLFAFLLGFGSPLKPSHILWINLITDSLPALALGMDSGTKDYMKKPPRHKEESLFSKGGLFITLFYGFVIAGITLTAFLHLPMKYLTAHHLPLTLTNLKLLLTDSNLLLAGQTYAFMVLGISELFHAIGMRNTEKSLFATNPFSNRLMLVALLLGLGLQFAVTGIAPLSKAFGTYALSLQDWKYLLPLSALPLLFHEILLLFRISQNDR